MRVAKNIQWDLDINEAREILDSMTAEEAAETLEIPLHRYANMTTEERHDYAYSKFHYYPITLNEFLGLPFEIPIPENIEDDDIADWLSDTYGYCHKGFEITEE